MNICKLVNVLRAINVVFFKSSLLPGGNKLQNKVYFYLCGHESFALVSVFYILQNCKIAQSNTVRGTGPYRIGYSQRICQTMPRAPLKGHSVILFKVSPHIFWHFPSFLIPTSQPLSSLLVLHYSVPLNASFSGEII